LGDDSIVGPEVVQELETGDIAKADVNVIEGAKVHKRSGIDDELGEGLVDIMVCLVDLLIVFVLPVGFGVLDGGGVIAVVWSHRRVMRSFEDAVAAGDGGVHGVGVAELEEAVLAGTSVGMDRGGVAVQLGLSFADGLVIWTLGFSGNGG